MAIFDQPLPLSIRGLITADIKQHFSFAIHARNSAVRTRGHPFKLKTTRSRLNIAQHLFFNRVVSTWNGLPEHIVNIEYFLSFKKALRTINFQYLITFDRHAIVYYIIVFCFSYVHAQHLY